MGSFELKTIIKWLLSSIPFLVWVIFKVNFPQDKQLAKGDDKGHLACPILKYMFLITTSKSSKLGPKSWRISGHTLKGSMNV